MALKDLSSSPPSPEDCILRLDSRACRLICASLIGILVGQLAKQVRAVEHSCGTLGRAALPAERFRRLAKTAHEKSGLRPTGNHRQDAGDTTAALHAAGESPAPGRGPQSRRLAPRLRFPHLAMTPLG